MTQPHTTMNREKVEPNECADIPRPVCVDIPRPVCRVSYLNPETGKFQDNNIRGAGMIRFSSLPPSKDDANPNPNMIFEFIEKLKRDTLERARPMALVCPVKPNRTHTRFYP